MSLLELPYDSQNLVLVDDVYKPPEPRNPPLLGAGGTRILTYMAVARGVQLLHLVYIQPWYLPKVVDAKGQLVPQQVSNLGVSIDQKFISVKVK